MNLIPGSYEAMLTHRLQEVLRHGFCEASCRRPCLSFLCSSLTALRQFEMQSRPLRDLPCKRALGLANLTQFGKYKDSINVFARYN
jgi:hypothetical protein